jgi:transglycosylase-like protein with SLT domain/uncharacterized protein DUF4124
MNNSKSYKKRNTTLLAAIAAMVLIPFQTAVADIFQYTDDSGVIHFSNVSVGGGKKYRKVRSEATDMRPREQTPRSAASSPAPVKNVPAVYAEIISSACDRHGVDPSLVHAIVKVESDFNPYALSRKGAMGLMQLMPQTALNMNVQNTFNPHENIDGGVKYLRYLIDRYEGNLSLALAAYNSGETAVKKWGTVPPFPETQNYVQRILKLYNGTGSVIAPHFTTIYVGHGEDGALLLTDDPYKHKDKNLKRKTSKNL